MTGDNPDDCSMGPIYVPVYLAFNLVTTLPLSCRLPMVFRVDHVHMISSIGLQHLDHIDPQIWQCQYLVVGLDYHGIISTISGYFHDFDVIHGWIDDRCQWVTYHLLLISCQVCYHSNQHPFCHDERY
jgi:hypothetical protein